MGLNLSRVDAPCSFGMSAKKEELVAPPIFFLFMHESYHSDEILLDYVPTFFIEMKGETIWPQSFILVELIDCF
jgi:hypothetical protein